MKIMASEEKVIKALDPKLRITWGDTLANGIIFCVVVDGKENTYKINGIADRSDRITLARFCDEGTRTIEELLDVIELI